MGTRGAYGFVVDGTEKITYNHFDSYPGCLGVSILDFVGRHTDAEIRDIAARIDLVDRHAQPTEDQITHCASKNLINLDVSERSTADWYCLLRNAQNGLDAWSEGLKFMVDNKEFLADSLFCEWAYILNCDTGTLEVYRGFNHDRDGRGRYAGLSRDFGDIAPAKRYFGVVLILEIPFDEARKMQRQQFVAVVEEGAKEEE